MVYEVTEITEEVIEEMEQYRSIDKTKGLIENCASSPIIFAEKMLGLKLYAWQVRFMKDLLVPVNSDNRNEEEKEFVAITSRQIGKEQPITEPVLTPKGWTMMGALKVGDKVIGGNGEATTVTDIFPQGVKDVYRITFNDGSSTRCGLEHLWKAKHSGCKHWKTVSLKQMIENNGNNPSSDNAYRIPLVKPVVFKENKHIISPYLMGALLGDGCITTHGGLGITSDDEEIISKALKGLEYTVSNKQGTTAKSYRFTGESKQILSKELMRLKLLGTNSSTKFIPLSYQFDSVENRKELLRGLMDTDGTIYGKCVMEYYTVSDALSKDVRHLVESLGGTFKHTIKKTHYKKDGKRIPCKDCHRIKVKFYDLNPFNLKRKADLYYTIKYKPHRIVKSIELIGKEESQCIMVDNEDHTYITNNFIVTHNSTLLAIFSIWCCIFNKVQATTYNNTTVGISSASDIQAKKLLLEMKKYIRLGDVFIRTEYTEDGKAIFGDKLLSNLLDEHEANNTTTISFKPWSPEHGEFFLKGCKSGSTIKSYAATAAVLGETFSVVVIDEAGMTERISDMFFKEYMYPTGNSTDAIRIYTSTPWVPQGFFYRMVDPDNLYGSSPALVHAYTIDAIEIENTPYYSTVQKKVKQFEADGDYNEVQRAYYCRFVKGEQSYFDPDNILRMFYTDMYQETSFEGPCDMGVDFGGQVKSKTVITISTLNEDNEIVRLYVKSYEVGEDTNLIQDIESLMTTFNVQRVVVDDCPAGIYLIRIMEDEKGWNVVRFNFRAEKVKKYGGFRSMLKKNKIKSFEDDKLKTEMLAMEYSNGSRQSVLQHAPGYSDDRIDSFVMSCTNYIQEEGGLKFFDY